MADTSLIDWAAEPQARITEKSFLDNMAEIARKILPDEEREELDMETDAKDRERRGEFYGKYSIERADELSRLADAFKAGSDDPVDIAYSKVLNFRAGDMRSRSISDKASARDKTLEKERQFQSNPGSTHFKGMQPSFDPNAPTIREKGTSRNALMNLGAPLEDEMPKVDNLGSLTWDATGTVPFTGGLDEQTPVIPENPNKLPDGKSLSMFSSVLGEEEKGWETTVITADKEAPISNEQLIADTQELTSKVGTAAEDRTGQFSRDLLPGLDTVPLVSEQGVDETGFGGPISPVKGLFLSQDEWGNVSINAWENIKRFIQTGDEKAAFRLVATLAGGGATKAGMATSSELGVFGGKLAKGFERAKTEGRTYIGHEGAEKFEINTSLAKWGEANTKALVEAVGKPGPKPSMELSALMSNRALFDAYPDAKNIRIVADKDLKPGNAFIVDNDIHLSPKDIGRERGKLNVEHEVQHWIQRKEGFARGGSVEDTASINDLDTMFTKLINLKANKADAEGAQMAVEGIQAGGRAFIDALPAALNLVDSRFKGKTFAAAVEYLGTGALSKAQRLEISEGMGYQLYRRLAGEVEARNAERRLFMTGPEREETPPNLTEDIKKSAQTVARGISGRMNSMIDEGGFGKPSQVMDTDTQRVFNPANVNEPSPALELDTNRLFKAVEDPVNFQRISDMIDDGLVSPETANKLMDKNKEFDWFYSHRYDDIQNMRDPLTVIEGGKQGELPLEPPPRSGGAAATPRTELFKLITGADPKKPLAGSIEGGKVSKLKKDDLSNLNWDELQYAKEVLEARLEKAKDRRASGPIQDRLKLIDAELDLHDRGLRAIPGGKEGDPKSAGAAATPRELINYKEPGRDKKQTSGKTKEELIRYLTTLEDKFGIGSMRQKEIVVAVRQRFPDKKYSDNVIVQNLYHSRRRREPQE